MLKAKIENSYIIPTEKNTDKILDFIKKSIRKSKSSEMNIDISSLNLMDASKVATIASTYHYLRFNEGCIKWIVASKEVEKMLKPLNLGNSKFVFA
ncbi:MAG: hypothetical protein ACI4SM_01880 [Candidatus Gastranaerophilaceae bacterium]